MGFFSVILNIVTIVLVLTLFYVGYNIYRTREDKSATATEIFDQMLFDPDTVSHSYMSNARYGPIGDFGSYDYEKVNSTQF